MIAWSLWNACNRVQFWSTQSHPEEIFKQAMSLMEEYQNHIRDLVQKQWT